MLNYAVDKYTGVYTKISDKTKPKEVVLPNPIVVGQNGAKIQKKMNLEEASVVKALQQNDS